MGQLKRGDLLKKENVKIEKVFINDNDFVYVKSMTARVRDELESSSLVRHRNKKGLVTSVESDLSDFRARLAVRTICDEKGKELLNIEDYKTLSQNITARSLEFIINKAQEINGISDGDVDELIKNSKAAPSGNSISVSV